MRYFISDLHFFDEGIIGYCGRPFRSAAEMNAALAAAIRGAAQAGNEIYILGDLVGMNGGIEKCAPVFKEMGLGTTEAVFRLIMGNHDLLYAEDYLAMGFKSADFVTHITIGGRKVMLAHDPCMIQPADTIAICGHIHTLFDTVYNAERNILAINVSVERRAYRPVSEKEIEAIIAASEWKSPE